MKPRILTILTLVVLFVNSSFGQNLSPIDLAKAIFSQEKFPALKKHITGEYNGEPNGKSLNKNVTPKFLLLNQTETKAVVAMTLLDSTGTGFDAYLYFVKDSVWKMCAFRGLALTGIIQTVHTMLEKLSAEQVDSILIYAENNQDKKEFLFFSTREEYEFELGNTGLTLETDDNIIEHFLRNKNEFERIKDSLLIEIQTTNVDEEYVIKLGEKLKSDYQKLFISSVTIGGFGFDNCINFLIGGMVDNSVGYIYIKDKKELPEMDPDRIIMIREIGNGWYIYKTT